MDGQEQNERVTIKVIGPFRDPRMNEIGDCLGKSLIVSKMWFKCKSIHMYTWEGDEYKSKSMIDFMVHDEKLRRLGKDTRAIRGFEYGTECYLKI